ncbi:MAG: cysteine synthase family protein [Bacteroidota bacterium]
MIEAPAKESLKEKVNRLERFIGNTPLLPIQNLVGNERVKLYAKLEWYQLGSSVKSRPAFNIFKTAIESDDLVEGKTLLDASSGNTAIAYATIGASLGIPVTICLPENASDERKKILNALGAKVVYTSKFGSTDEAQEKAQELVEKHPDEYFYADQYNNESNWKAHYHGTAQEIIKEVGNELTHFIAGLGTTGTFTGTGRGLKDFNENIKLVGLQPDNAMHGLEGWKHLETAKVPGIYDQQLADEIHEVDSFEAFEYLKRAAKEEGLMLSPSSAANLMGAIKVAEQIDEGTIVTVFPDNMDKYSELLKMLF